MAYRIDAGSGEAGTPAAATIVLVGCGGTGGFLAESICRLMIGRRGSLQLVDMDRVEKHNVARQCFDSGDVGHFKSQVLAERLARRFGRQIGYSVLPYDFELHADLFAEAGTGLRLLIGCVDNATARRTIAATLDAPRWHNGYPSYPSSSPSVWWCDAGNGRNAGQVLLGNKTRRQELRGAFVPELSLCRALPAPSLQRPDLLDTPPAPEPRPDCAEAIAQAEQGGTINQIVASIAASYVEKLLDGTCRWMASYFDLDDGTLRCIPADPKAVAGTVGLRSSVTLTRASAQAA